MGTNPHKLAASFIVIFILGAMLGCTGTDESSPGAPPPSEPESLVELEGSWSSECIDSSIVGVGELTTIVFVGPEFKRTVRAGASGQCKDSFLVATLSGSYTAGDVASTGVGRLDLVATSAVVLPTSEQGARILSLARACGITDWVVSVERDVLGRLGTEGCFERYPKASFTVYAFDDSRLYFGVGEASALQRRRAIRVDDSVPYRR